MGNSNAISPEWFGAAVEMMQQQKKQPPTFAITGAALPGAVREILQAHGASLHARQAGRVLAKEGEALARANDQMALWQALWRLRNARLLPETEQSSNLHLPQLGSKAVALLGYFEEVCRLNDATERWRAAETAALTALPERLRSDVLLLEQALYPSPG